MRSDADSAPAARSRAERGRLTLVTGIVLGVIALDQLTKLWAVAALSEAPTSIIGTTIELRLARNTGGALSLFQGFTPVLAVLAVVVAVVLVRVLQRTTDRIMLVALSLVLAGAVGNLIDRIFRSPGFLRGGVIDFIGIDRFPTFNVADSAITIGAVLLVLWGWRREPVSR